MLRCCLFCVGMLMGIMPLIAQENYWFYLRAKDSVFSPNFTESNSKLVYRGNDVLLKAVLDKYEVYEFKKTFRKAKLSNLKKTFFVIANKKEMMEDLLLNASHVFVFGEHIAEEDKKIFEPNDYGLTSTIGENTGLQADLSYLDDIDMPKAWYYTTGSPDVIIGISDGSVDTTNIDFKDKTTVFHKSNVAGGHGYSIAANAAAQGDNGYGIPGVCYDCSIYSTNYGDFRNLAMVMELSRAGAKVVNCSWIGRQYYETAQAAVDEMFANGTIIVAAGGNKSWGETKGELLYYPASYNHVISVGVGTFRHENVLDNIKVEKNGNYYAENIRGYVGRTLGFKNNDTLAEPHIWAAGTSTLNSGIDILAPSTGQFMFSKFILDGTLEYHPYSTTSGATPFVSGTIGLMFSLYPCLPMDEVESLLKISAENIDHINANKPYEGKYGAGLLNTGNTIKLLYQLHTEDEIATIENQMFSRWDFKLTAYSKQVQIQNMEFTKSATLDLIAKNAIILGPNTVLKPGEKGNIHLKIDNGIKKECDLRLRKDD